MAAVLSTVSPYFEISADARLTGTGSESWWIAPWMDVTSSGREPRMGLTRERGPDEGDLAEGSSDGFQVWAVGFYNQAGAAALSEMFEDPCNPSLPAQFRFPRSTAAVKFLFTNAGPSEVTYLAGAPTYKALIDPPNAPRDTTPEDRIESDVRLLQVDIAVKDRRATNTDWVFGTFVWMGPSIGDTLFDNLVPVSLQWGNDPGVYNHRVQESWINTDLEGKLYGWDERPTLGFNGRANGPADNIRSSCLSCHATARTPRSSHGILGRFDMSEIGDAVEVKEHVDRYFQNLGSRDLFTPEENAIASLDYSLQIEAGIYRMCLACRVGSLSGPTPQLCRASGFYNRASCRVIAPLPSAPNANVLSQQSAEIQDFIKGIESEDDIRQLMVLPPARQ